MRKQLRIRESLHPENMLPGVVLNHIFKSKRLLQTQDPAYGREDKACTKPPKHA
jgi:hypothetical protein